MCSEAKENKECVLVSVNYSNAVRKGKGVFVISVCLRVGGIKACQNLTAQPPVHSLSLSVSLSFTVRISLCQAKVNDQAAARELQLDKLSNSS